MDLSRFRKPRTCSCRRTRRAERWLAASTSAHSGPPLHRLAFSEFLKAVDAGKVTEVTFDEPTMDVVLRDGSVARRSLRPSFSPPTHRSSPTSTAADIRVDVTPAPDPGALSWGAMATAAAFLALLGFTVYRTTAGRIPSISGRAARRRARASTSSRSRTWRASTKPRTKSRKSSISCASRGASRPSAVAFPKGVLLVGPPGTGKTLLARSIAGEAGVPFLFASGSDFVEMYAGVGASRVRRLFRDARRHPSCIIFIDELDAVGRSRGGNSLSHEEREQTLNQLLVEMDGFESHRGIVVIAATNRQDILDPALLRPGPLRSPGDGRQSRPEGTRGHPARPHAQDPGRSPTPTCASIARGTPGFSGADLANLVNEAALLAGRAGRTHGHRRRSAGGARQGADGRRTALDRR